VENREDVEVDQVVMVSAKELPLKGILQVEVDGRWVFGFLETFDHLLENEEEVHSGLVFKVSPFTLNVFHVVSNFILVAPESTAEPVQMVFQDVLRAVQAD